MDQTNDCTRPRHPNDPDVVAHQMKMAGVTMTKDEREELLASVDRQLREIEDREGGDSAVAAPAGTP